MEQRGKYATTPVLVAGGLTCCGYFAFASAEVYDPSTGRWTYTEDMQTPRFAAAVALLPNGKVLVAGGGTMG